MAAITLLLSPMALFAATGAENSNTNHFNTLLIALVTLIVILLFAIMFLGNIVRQMAIVYRDKMRAQRSGTIVKTLALLATLSLGTYAARAEDAAQAATSTMPKAVGGIPATDFYMLMSIVLLELLVLFALAFVLRMLVRLVSNKPLPEETTAAAAGAPVIKVSFWDRFNKVVPIEKEHDILLDHNYDGIQELDNSLPPWWKYGFYVTIVVGVIYLWYYHAGGNGPSSYDEYVAEVQKGEEDKAAYLASSANNVDENTVKMVDATGVAAGQVIFQNMCAACHAKDGGGGVGPNLTDDYWLHGGSLKDVFKTIKYGWPDKGMKSWKDDFSPSQIAQIASYVKSLQGSKPAAPKEKQGDLFIDGQPTTDSTKAVAANK